MSSAKSESSKTDANFYLIPHLLPLMVFFMTSIICQLQIRKCRLVDHLERRNATPFLKKESSSSSGIFTMSRRPDGTLEATGGADTTLLNMLSRYVPFQYELKEQEDHTWGAVGEDGNWTGMIGSLQRGESDMAFGWIANTYIRDQVVDFSFPYLVDATIFFTPSPHLSAKSFAFLDPFQNMVWLMLLLSLPLSAGVLALLTRSSTQTGQRQKMGCAFLKELERLFGLLIGQGTYKVYSRPVTRLFMGIWSAVKLVLVFSYCSTLLSLMMVPTSERPIDTVQQLREAVLAGKQQVAVYRGISHYEYLMSADSGPLKDLADNLRGHPENLLTNFEAGAQRLNRGEKLATLVMRMHFRYVASVSGDHRYHQSKDTIGHNPVSVAFQKGFPDKERINRIIHRITESGVYSRELDIIRYKLSLRAPRSTHGRDKRALTLEDLEKPLEILLEAEGLAALILFLEIFYYKLKSRK